MARHWIDPQIAQLRAGDVETRDAASVGAARVDASIGQTTGDERAGDSVSGQTRYDGYVNLRAHTMRRAAPDSGRTRGRWEDGLILDDLKSARSQGLGRRTTCVDQCQIAVPVCEQFNV